MIKSVLYGFKHENIREKLKWFLSLSEKRRYQLMVSYLEMARAVNKKRRRYSYVGRAFKAV